MPDYTNLVLDHSDLIREVWREEFGVGISHEELIGRSRNPTVCHARKALVESLFDTGLIRQCEIGEALGGRDHATINYYLRTVGEV